MPLLLPQKTPDLLDMYLYVFRESHRWSYLIFEFQNNDYDISDTENHLNVKNILMGEEGKSFRRVSSR